MLIKKILTTCLIATIATGALAATAKKAKANTFVYKPQSEEVKIIASLIKSGRYNCEFNQHVDIKVRDDQLGYVDVTFKGKTSHMLPVVSNSGALRLESKVDHRFWLQLMSKSMLFDSQGGSRLADDCQP